MKRTCFFLALLALPFLMASGYGQKKKHRTKKSLKTVSAAVQSGDIKLGAYYFDGWGTMSSKHLTPKLRDSFPDRKPKWGWVTSTPDAMKDQIDLAADAGLSFFSFDWYYPDYNKKNFSQDPLNHALNLYLAAPNKGRLQFCVMVANHAGQEIGPEDWPAVTDEWVKLMKDPGYLKVSGKPYLIFFDMKSLVRLFGGNDGLHKALSELRGKAGASGVTLAVCVSPNKQSIQQANDCGFDVVTGYNYPDPAFKDRRIEHDVDNLTGFGSWVWNQFRNSALPYVPVATLNWDPRPWANGNNWYSRSVRYTGYNSNTVYRNVKALQQWIDANSSSTTKDRIAMLYAWNEYGEGAWLTPSAIDTLNLLSGVKRAMSK